MGEDATQEAAGPRLGQYHGHRRDYSCPGDHATWEIELRQGGVATISCRSELSPSKGGLNAWQVQGTWTWDGDDWEVVIAITKDDPLGGPKLDQDVSLPFGEDGSLKYRGVECVWAKPPPDVALERLEAMPLKELKATAFASRLDPSGCIERGDFLRILMRAKAGGTLRFPEEAAEASPPSASPASSPKKAASASSRLGSSPTASGAAGEAAPQASASAAPEPAAAPAPAPAAAESTAAAAPAAAAAAPAAEAAVAASEAEGTYTLDQLTDKRQWEKLDVKPTDRERYLPASVFKELFGMGLDDFSKLPKWKQDNLKKKHNLF